MKTKYIKTKFAKGNVNDVGSVWPGCFSLTRVVVVSLGEVGFRRLGLTNARRACERARGHGARAWRMQGVWTGQGQCVWARLVGMLRNIQ